MDAGLPFRPRDHACDLSVHWMMAATRLWTLKVRDEFRARYWPMDGDPVLIDLV